MSIASLYPSINPSLLLDFANSKVLDSRVTFTRTTTATYYDGVTTAKAEENLLVQSQFAASWTTFNATLTANTTTAPDGTSTAATVVENTANNQHVAYQFPSLITAATYTFSCYIKAGTRNYGMLRDAGNAIKIDLTNGTTTVIEGSPTSHSATSVGNGWYRCVMTVASINNNFQVGPHDNGSTTTYTGNGTGSVYVWGAQLEQRSSATAYTATTTQAITNYIPVLQTAAAGQARFDHNPTTGESLGLLIEEARTNLATYSESISSWTPQTATVQDNQAVAPNGTLTAEKVIPSSTGANRGCYTSFTASGVTTISIYVKYGGYQWVRLLGPAVAGSVWFDVLNGVKGTEGSGVTGTITAVGNGWYRISVTQSQTGTSYVQVNVASADNSTSVTVATNDVFSGVFLWGAQAETGGASFATSYIPNLSTGSTTRNADAASMTGTNFSSWFNNGEGTFYSEGKSPLLASYTNPRFAVVNDGSSNNRIELFVTQNSTVSVSGGESVYTNGAEQVNITKATSNSADFHKVASVYKVNDFAATADGLSVSTDTAGTIPVVNQLQIGNGLAANFINGPMKKLAYYPIRVTNAQLQALTV